MAWVAAGIIGFIALILGAKAFVNADPKALAKGLRWGAAISLGGLALFMLLRGRIDMSMMLAFTAAWVLGKMPFPFFGGGRGLGGGWTRARTGSANAGGNGGQASAVETAWLRMTLDHATGTMSGEVRQGRFQGRTLAQLSFAELLALHRECAGADNQSAALIEAYLDRSIGPDWREKAAAEGAAQTENAAPAPGGMNREQAYEVLGLKPGASDDEIREAHRRLMKQFHPDHGGSNYLAGQINRAKDVLLGG